MGDNTRPRENTEAITMRIDKEVIAKSRKIMKGYDLPLSYLVEDLLSGFIAEREGMEKFRKDGIVPTLQIPVQFTPEQKALIEARGKARAEEVWEKKWGKK